MTTAILYAYQRDGVLNHNTICNSPKGAAELARVYCVNMVQDAIGPKSNRHTNAWTELTQTGRLELVELYCRVSKVEGK